MIGVGALFIAAILTGLAALLNLMNMVNKRKTLTGVAAGQERKDFTGVFYDIAVGCTVIASIFLWYIILSNQFAYEYVAAYSGAELSAVFKITAFWAGAEGSLLLWALLHGLVGLILNHSKAVSQGAKMIFAIVQLGLLILIIIRSPFELMSTASAAGRGLSPLLQNFWMISHPPLLFLGYTGLAVPFSLAVGSLIEGDYQPWVKRALPFSLFSWAFLGLGIFFGGYWAYETLGWGGYWAWDPVENSSLIPWLACAALVHFLVLSLRKKTSLKMAYLMAIVSFGLALYGTYLTRSGVLDQVSVHSFSVNTDALSTVLGVMVLLTLAVPIVLLIVKWMSIPATEEEPVLTRGFMTYTGAVLLSVFAVFVLTGTAMPHMMNLIGQVASVGSSFYNVSALLLIVPILALIVLATVLMWRTVAHKADADQEAPEKGAKKSSGKGSSDKNSSGKNSKEATGKGAKEISDKKTQKGADKESEKEASGQDAEEVKAPKKQGNDQKRLGGRGWGVIAASVLVAAALSLVFLFYGGFANSSVLMADRPGLASFLSVVLQVFMVLGLIAASVAFVVSAVALAAGIPFIKSAVPGGIKTGKGMNAPALFTHMGLAVLVIGIIFSSGAASGAKAITLKNGEPQVVLGQEITYTGRDSNEQGYTQNFVIGGKSVGLLTQLDASYGFKSNPQIVWSLTGDYYLSTHLESAQSLQTNRSRVETLDLIGEQLQIMYKDVAMAQNAAGSIDLTFIYEVTLGELKEDKELTTRVTLDDEDKMTGSNSEPLVVFDKYMLKVNQFDGEFSTISLTVTPLGDPNKVTVDVSSKPLISLVWLGTIMISAGILWAALRRWGPSPFQDLRNRK